MRQASVGFQCPSCVKEGARTVRAPRGAYGGRRSGDPRLTSFVLIGINVLVWLAVVAAGGNGSRLLDRLALLPNGQCARGNGIYPGAGEQVCSTLPAHWVAGVADGAWWQVITSVFTHVEPLHIGLNMLTLFFIGPPVEMVLGRARFVALYLVSGLTGSAAVMLFSSAHTQTLGASGALFGLMGALVVLAHKVGGDYQQVLVWLGLNLVFTFTVANISWQGHLGGLVGGLLLAATIAYAPRVRRALVQWSAVVLLAGIAVAVIAVRAAALADPSVLS
jgi:membrane associated rhomboid family serine protease